MTLSTSIESAESTPVPADAAPASTATRVVDGVALPTQGVWESTPATPTWRSPADTSW